MEHLLITGGHEFLPFARSCITKLKKLGLPYADQSYEVDGVSIKVRIEPGHEYIRISATAKGDFWCLSKEYVGGVPSLCVYSLSIKAGYMFTKRIAAIQLYPGEASSVIADVKGSTTAWVLNGNVEAFQSRAYSSGTHSVSLIAYEPNGYGNPQTMTVTGTVANDTRTTISCSRFPSSTTSTTGIVVRHTSAEPGLGGGEGAYADYYHHVNYYNGPAVNPPSFSYYCSALSARAFVYPPVTYSIGNFFSGAPLYMYVTLGAPPFIGGTQEGTVSLEHLVVGVGPGAILTELQPGTINAGIWYGNGKGGMIDPEFINGYYVGDTLSNVNPTTGKYVLRMFKHYYFGFDTGSVLARAYTYAGELVPGAPFIMIPDFPLWIDRLQAASPAVRTEWRRWINVGKDATVYEWNGSDGVPRFGVVAHRTTHMQDIKTQEQLFGVLDLDTRVGFEWFVPVRPYVVGPEFSKMTPY